MSEKEDELAEDVLSELFENFQLPEHISKTENFGLEIRIATSKGNAIINYDLLAAAKWIANKNKEEFIAYWNEFGESDQELYFSLHNSFVIEASISILETLIQQLAAEFEDTIQTLPLLAITLDECIGNEYQKPMFDKEEFPEQSDSKKIVGNFISNSAKKRKERMMKPINDIKDQSKPDLKQMALHYEKLLPIWSNAKKLFEQISDKDNWLQVIKLANQADNLPDDLIRRLSSLDSYESMPSRISLEHSARLCGVSHNTYQWRRLNDYLTRSRELHGLSAKRGKRRLH